MNFQWRALATGFLAVSRCRSRTPRVCRRKSPRALSRPTPPPTRIFQPRKRKREMSQKLTTLPDWTGRTVAVMASGPSSSPSTNALLREAGVPVIATNTTGKLHCDILYAADSAWWMCQENEWALKKEVVRVTASSGVPFSQVFHVDVTGIKGYDPVVGNIRTGHNSGYQALHLAMQTGASKIILLGVDMTTAHGVHWHGRHTGRLGNPTEAALAGWSKMFPRLASTATEMGVEIVNCSMISVLRCFRISPLEKELEGRSSSTRRTGV